jgi:hypothetical protein
MASAKILDPLPSTTVALRVRRTELDHEGPTSCCAESRFTVFFAGEPAEDGLCRVRLFSVGGGYSKVPLTPEAGGVVERSSEEELEWRGPRSVSEPEGISTS